MKEGSVPLLPPHFFVSWNRPRRRKPPSPARPAPPVDLAPVRDIARDLRTFARQLPSARGNPGLAGALAQRLSDLTDRAAGHNRAIRRAVNRNEFKSIRDAADCAVVCDRMRDELTKIKADADALGGRLTRDQVDRIEKLLRFLAARKARFVRFLREEGQRERERSIAAYRREVEAHPAPEPWPRDR